MIEMISLKVQNSLHTFCKTNWVSDRFCLWKPPHLEAWPLVGSPELQNHAPDQQVAHLGPRSQVGLQLVLKKKWIQK